MPLKAPEDQLELHVPSPRNPTISAAVFHLVTEVADSCFQWFLIFLLFKSAFKNHSLELQKENVRKYNQLNQSKVHLGR